MVGIAVPQRATEAGEREVVSQDQHLVGRRPVEEPSAGPVCLLGVGVTTICHSGCSNDVCVCS